MSKRKLTLEIVVDQDSKDWHWLYEVMIGNSPLNGFLDIFSIANEHTSSQVSEALCCAFNEGLLSERECK